ncbi:unnamed protein product [Tilletia laevis]|uniref:Ser-Thr-rich glycosyl-phosphatidyl-inositol-anchored membrane family-domain-containing protein n=2 Tax=Tilletia TaxID=13289 RepID=A0A177UCR6_9BASI|nr:hypothetical protein CF336_g3662 [Tilletia laevis]KAE8262404.1 hypothetical protein A4X03_0g2483 [Tilletia caries]CAD6944719.1 unnamed protein product [Tilletia controversa]KAE8201872.1 hypothetical protein CF335_g3636 [Tilletia laevis]CAD6886323.1 unnamed protein product [Tilletia caries]
MQFTLPFTAGLVFSLASSALGSSHRVPLGSRDHHALTERAATFTPTAPGPGDVYKVDTPIPIQWQPDTSGSSKWKSTTIRLMTGANLNMSQLTVVGVIDGTDASTTSLSWTAPAVDPYSAIYFFQFDHGGDSQLEPQWTTRFSIADADGQTTTPPNANQPGSKDGIAWGVGRLASGSGSGSSSDANSTDSSSSTTATTPLSQTASSTADDTTKSQTTSSSSSASKTSSSSTSTPSSTTPSNAAAPRLLSQPVGMALAGAGIGLAAAFIL